MASSVDRYRPPRGDAYVPPTLPAKPAAPADRRSKSRSPSRRREIPPAVPTPPTASSRNSPPRPHSHRGPPSPSQPSSSRNPHADQWIFTADELLSTPSILDGMPPAEERMKRAKGVNFIYQVGITVQPQPLPQLTLYVAGVFFHRFYMRWSMVESKGGYHPYNIAATSLFLANKTEENCYKTKSLIIAIAKVAQKNPELVIDELSEEYWRWRDTILQCEEIMLEILTFDLNIINPYQQLWHHLDKLGLLHDKAIRNQAWAFLNDAGLTTLPVLFDASEIAVLSIFFASESKDIKIKDQDGVPWWKVLEGDEHRIAAGMEVVEQFFMNNPLGKRDPRQPRSPGFTLDSTRRRGGEGFLSQHEVDSSRGGTPMDVDGRGTQSQDSRANGRVKEEHDSQHDSMGLPNMRGDSDAALKAAANDLDSHPINTTNGDGLRSPSFKRKNEDEPMAESGQESKRRRLSDHDEGEIEA